MLMLNVEYFRQLLPYIEGVCVTGRMRNISVYTLRLSIVLAIMSTHS